MIFLLMFFIFSFPFYASLHQEGSFAFDFGVTYHIDCGSATNSTDGFKIEWLSDRFFSSGSVGIVSEPLLFKKIEKTLRFFPSSNGKKNCYSIRLPNGRYMFRTFTVYDNYDGKNRPPSFSVAVEGTQVFSWSSPWPDDLSRTGAYSDLFAYVKDDDADVCFYGIATDPPVIGSLEIVQIDSRSYSSFFLGDNHLLVNYGRLSCYSDQWGLGFSNDTDVFGRSWQPESEFRTGISRGIRLLTTDKEINGSNKLPNYFPMKLYQKAVIGNLEYQLPVDAKLDYLIWFHFAEIGESVNVGERVFDILINGKNVTRVDIMKEVGEFAAFSWHYVVRNLSSTKIDVRFSAVYGSPLINGLENYAMVPVDLSTVPEQAFAMKELKQSLSVPDRMGWNGDPCAPTDWDAWEGVTCHPNVEKSALIIFQIDLGSQGLKGFVSEKIALLSDLASLNLSSNSLWGKIPIGIGQKSLIRLDLSYNHFSGPIPNSLTASSLQLVLLNDNLLEGDVPEALFSVGVHGGVIDLTGNKGLCGMPSLPSCPFWGGHKLSRGAKAAIALSSLVVIFLLASLILAYCIRIRRNDYDFGLPRDLMKMSSRRNRYHRQKSLMVLEMESMHAKGLPMSPHVSH